MPASQFTRRAILVLANVLLPVAVLAFASGFFPYKPMIPGMTTDRDESISAPFDRVIFMVVDALRSDFVYGHGTGFEFTQSLIRDGAGIPFTAHATPPTVTMPRVKALTTGSVPSFLDLILNFAESDTSSSLATQDTWLAQLRARENSKLVFYGDDTWLKLFPGDFFARYDGTSSFFVSDSTEVDHNVTRHLPTELANTDWNALIMHYLGMDHIGHKTGPQGPNMLPKQKEMDDIVKMIYATLEQKQHERTLLVLAGDHGMNGGGNHGGSGPGETEPALLFISPQLKKFSKQTYECPTQPREGTQFHFYSKLEQSDVVPTLAAILGFPIPRNSIGVVMREMLGYWTVGDQVKLLERNSRQLLDIYNTVMGESAWSAAQHRYLRYVNCVWQCTPPWDMNPDCEGKTFSQTSNGPGLSPEEKVKALYDFAQWTQQTLSNAASSYNIPYMVAGIVVALISLVLGIIALQPTSITPTGFYFSLLTGLYGVMMFASSYVEEEQHLWYWMTPAWFALLTCRSISATSTADTRQIVRLALYGLVLTAAHRLSISWNQTGQKHAGEPDIAHTFFPEQHILMWLLILATYILIAYRLVARTFQALFPQEMSAVIAGISIIPAIIFKLNFAQADTPELVGNLGETLRAWTEDMSLVLQARIVFSIIAILFLTEHIIGMLEAKSGITLAARMQPLLTLFLATQTRAPNIPLLLLMDVQASILKILLNHNYWEDPRTDKKSRKAFDIAITTLLLAHTTYFCFGGSNSISTLDLSHAYNGVADYNILAVGILLFASNWTGPIWWSVTAIAQLLPRPRIPYVPLTEAEMSAENRVQSYTVPMRREFRYDPYWAGKDLVRIRKKYGEAVTGTDKQDRSAWLTYMAATTIFFAAGLVAVMAACTALRTHLFIWTVFSPKYLYAMAWSIGWHLLVNGVIGSTLWLIMSS